MTDNKIIKALECCEKRFENCDGCPYHNGNCITIEGKLLLMGDALDLINRQKAEIERLKVDLQSMRNAANSYKMHYETAKSEAIKEFAEKLKSKIWHRPECNYISSITPDYIDELVKEMMEVQK